MEAAQIVIKTEKGGIVVKAMGRTPRGTPYVKKEKAISAKSMADPHFKAQLKAAVDELLGSGE